MDRKKKGLLAANKQYQTNPGEGLRSASSFEHSNSKGFKYLRNFTWWAGMSTLTSEEMCLTLVLMIIGEIANFTAYAFTDAILVTPLGALTVVVRYN